MNIGQLTKEKCKSLFDYNNGKLIWKENRKPCIKSGDIAGNKKFDKYGYYKIKVEGYNFSSHVLIWNWHFDLIPEGLQIDHIKNVDPLIGADDRIENLQLLTCQDNTIKRKMPKNNKSGFVGVYYKESNKKWAASIRVNTKSKHLGYFLTKEDAAVAYNKAAKICHGKHAKQNIIP